MTDEKRVLIEPELREIIQYYNDKLEEMYDEINPGKIRSKKGDLVECIAEWLVNITWEKYLDQPEFERKPDKKKFKLNMVDVDNYVTRYEQATIADEIRTKKQSIYYGFGADRHIWINGNIALAIECKSYTENAMLKRIIYDRKLLNEKYPNATYVLLQLESALGGDFELCSNATFGSNQYHFFMSRENSNIPVITLLEGRRDADKPIHKRENWKELKMEHLLHAVEVFAKILEKYI